MITKILIPIFGNDISPRFDLAPEVYIASTDSNSRRLDERIVVLPQVSAEHLCHMILTENVDIVICGGIEEEYYQYLTWKRIRVVDSVIGEWEKAVSAFLADRLQPSHILRDKKEAAENE